MANLELFEQAGGTFLTPASALKMKMQGIRAFLFDWDGVFNDSRKSGKGESYFTEVESMGLNMLRFSNYLIREKDLPVMAVMSGEDNETAKVFLTREHFDICYFKAKDKKFALDHFMEKFKLKPYEIAFVFDDILDLSVAKVAGVRICVRRKANPLFLNYVIKNKLADYITGTECGNFSLREACELMTGLNGNYDLVLDQRIEYSHGYLEYLSAREKRGTEFLSAKNNIINPISV
jgi:3-deoxy-D-manno-octulosonate 8-phosphate phosphatase (KDO 8-P phosphatase)